MNIQMVYKDDNKGPPTVSQVIGFHETLQNEFPSATIIASSITNFVRNLSAHSEVVDSLKVIEKEIGDTWFVCFCLLFVVCMLMTHSLRSGLMAFNLILGRPPYIG